MIARTAAAMVMALALIAPASAGTTPAPEGARVYFIAPADGETVSNPVTVRFGLEGMGIAPAGIEKENTGHHHLLIGVDPADVDMEASLPAYNDGAEAVIHFGGGQTEITTELPAGTHTLYLLLGDQNHIPHDPPVLSDPITITVE